MAATTETKPVEKPWEVKAPKDLTDEERMQFFESIWGAPDESKGGLETAGLADIKSVFSPQELKNKYQEQIDLITSGKAKDKDGKEGASTAFFDFNGYRYGITKFRDGKFNPWRRKSTGGKGGASGQKDYYRLSGVFVGNAENVQSFLDGHSNDFWNYQESFDDKNTGERMYVLIRRQKWFPQQQTEEKPQEG